MLGTRQCSEDDTVLKEKKKDYLRTLAINLIDSFSFVLYVIINGEVSRTDLSYT